MFTVIIDSLCVFVEIEVKAQLAISNVSFTYYDTDFGFFQTSPDINQSDAQTECINWGGNLATIKSIVEDSLILYSIPDSEIAFSCHIGLNDIQNEAGTDGSAFEWIDGSTNIYRNFGTLFFNYPVDINNFDCVRNRYIGSNSVSQGWRNAPCNEIRNCYFCNKQGTCYISLI